MNFMNQITNFLDASEFYKIAFPNYKKEGGFPLKAVCQRLLRK